MPTPVRDRSGVEATRLSTAPVEDCAQVRSRGPRGLLLLGRRGWRRLTSMRTALILLLLLALAAVPGSLLPQRRLNPTKTSAYLRQHPAIGPIYDRLGLFDVFAAPWFAAIYLLLLISLVGCLIPRLRLHARALLRRPPPAPRHLNRLPQHTSFDTSAEAGVLQSAAAAALRRRRWRVRSATEPDGVLTLSAEKGYLRETGNLVFHLAVVLLLVAVAAGKLYGYSGTVVVDSGAGFCNTVAQFDSFTAGPLVDQSRLAPLCVRLKRFSASYTSAGIASQFRADISYTTTTAGENTRRDRLEVNHPLRRAGDRLYLLGHGFSPQFTVRDPQGDVFTRVDAPFLPEDANLTSSGVLKLPDTRPQQLALQGVFAPTATLDASGRLFSASPIPRAPAVAVLVYRGDLGLDAGRPQSVYALDPVQITRGTLRKVASRTLIPGGTIRLADGTRITFDGYTQWANLQVSHDPAQRLLLIAAVLIVLGLLSSLRVRRRRLWLRVIPTPEGSTSHIGGLAHSNPDANLREFEQLTTHLRGMTGTRADQERANS